MVSLRFLPLLGLMFAAACASPEDEKSGSGGAAASDGAEEFKLDVGSERAIRQPILIAGKASTTNMYAMAVASSAAYESGAELHKRLCRGGIHPRGTEPCGGGERAIVEADLATFDTAADDHAIYLKASLPSGDVGILAFRGTASTENLKTDLAGTSKIDRWGSSTNAPELAKLNLPGSAHAGFEGAAARLWAGDEPSTSLRQYIVDHHARAGAPPLYVTGHSLGAGVATVVMGYMLFGECSTIAIGERFSAPRASAAPGTLDYSLPATSCPASSQLDVQALYTYGSPRVGDRDFAEALSNMMALRRVAHFRVVNANDIVSRMAPRLFSGYTHLHLNIAGLSEHSGGVERKFALVEDENADAVYGERADGSKLAVKCRQYDGAKDNPEQCPTGSLAYLLPGDVPPEDRPRNEILRLGSGATQALDDTSSWLPSGKDHSLTQYLPLLKLILPTTR